jgi:integrase
LSLERIKATKTYERLCDLRHTYASLLLAERAPSTYVVEQLGHANASTTLRYYTKWIPKGPRRAARRAAGTQDCMIPAAEKGFAVSE